MIWQRWFQQALSRKKRGSHRRKKAVQAVARAHRKIRNQRKDSHHKASRQLVNTYQVIVFENVQATNLSKAPLPKDEELRQQLQKALRQLALAQEHSRE